MKQCRMKWLCSIIVRCFDFLKVDVKWLFVSVYCRNEINVGNMYRCALLMSKISRTSLVHSSYIYTRAVQCFSSLGSSFWHMPWYDTHSICCEYRNIVYIIWYKTVVLAHLLITVSNTLYNYITYMNWFFTNFSYLQKSPNSPILLWILCQVFLHNKVQTMECMC